MRIVLQAPSHQSELFCSVTSHVILYIIGLILLFSSRFSTSSHHNKAQPQSVWIYQFRCILLAPLSRWLLVVTSCSLQEHPGALFVKVRSNNGGQGGGGKWEAGDGVGGDTFFAPIGAWAVTWHLQPKKKAQNGVPAGHSKWKSRGRSGDRFRLD